MNSIDFMKKYSLIADSSSFHSVSKETQKCKFCKLEEPKTSFNNVTHVLPELLGSNNVIYQSECDNCNNIFSKYESHLAVFLRPYLTLNSIKGKKRVPKFQSRNDNKGTSTAINSQMEGKIEMYFNQYLDDFEIDKANKVIHVNFRKTPFKPRHIYKSIARIGISLLPETILPDYEHVCKWLKTNNDDLIDFIPLAFITMLNRKKFKHPFANLYKAKDLVIDNEILPDLTLVLGFANVVIQIFMPHPKDFDNIHSNNKNLCFNLFPGFVLDDVKNKLSIKISSVNLSSNEKICQNQKMSFSYEDLKRKI